MNLYIKMIHHKIHYCDECGTSSEDIDVLCHYSGMWVCEQCIANDPELDGLIWEHPSDFEDSYQKERKVEK